MTNSEAGIETILSSLTDYQTRRNHLIMGIDEDITRQSYDLVKQQMLESGNEIFVIDAKDKILGLELLNSRNELSAALTEKIIEKGNLSIFLEYDTRKPDETPKSYSSRIESNLLYLLWLSDDLRHKVGGGNYTTLSYQSAPAHTIHTLNTICSPISNKFKIFDINVGKCPFSFGHYSIILDEEEKIELNNVSGSIVSRLSSSMVSDNENKYTDVHVSSENQKDLNYIANRVERSLNLVGYSTNRYDVSADDSNEKILKKLFSGKYDNENPLIITSPDSSLEKGLLNDDTRTQIEINFPTVVYLGKNILLEPKRQRVGIYKLGELL
jgi:hypothetical protein